MTDIVEDLRLEQMGGELGIGTQKMLERAAVEIERLRAALAVAQETISHIAQVAGVASLEGLTFAQIKKRDPNWEPLASSGAFEP